MGARGIRGKFVDFFCNLLESRCSGLPSHGANPSSNLGGDTKLKAPKITAFYRKPLVFSGFSHQFTLRPFTPLTSQEIPKRPTFIKMIRGKFVESRSVIFWGLLTGEWGV